MLEEVGNVFYEKLGLANLSEQMQQYFDKALKVYMSHGRTYEYVVSCLDRLLEFFEAIGIGRIECAIILMNDFTLLNTVNELYDKYIFLGVIENGDNTFRNHKFFSKTKDYRTSLAKMYARYRLCLEAGYDDINWNILVHSSDNEFTKRFISSTYRKPYQMFDSPNQVMEWLAQVDINELDLEEFKALPVNKEIVEKYEGEKNRTM